MFRLRRFTWLATVGLTLVVLLMIGSGPSLSSSPVNSSSQLNTTKRGTFTEVQTPPSSAQQVKVGFYPVAIYDLDQSSNTFYADAYVWMRWKGEIDPSATIEFTNMVEEWGKLQEPIAEEPKTLPDGSKYQQFRVEGRFVQPFSLADYPLDRHSLQMTVEDTSHGINELAYVIDKDSSGVSQTLDIPGWKLQGWEAQTLEHSYGSNFGEVEQPSNYSVASFALVIERPVSFFLCKQMLPLVIIVMAALVALLLNPRVIDARLALPLGALLSAIFLQKGYADTLPDLGYLVFMDKIYLVAYALILAVLIRSIVAYMGAKEASDQEIEHMQKIDRRVLAILGGVFVLGCSVITILR